MDDIAATVRTTLDHFGVEYEALDCDPDFADTAAFCERYGVEPADSANAIVVVGKGDPRRHVCCVVLATGRLDVNGVIRKRLGVRKASFAPAEETTDVTGMVIGGVTPFALPGGVAVWIDAAVMERDTVVVGGGSRALKIRVSPDAFLQIPGAEVVEDLARVAPDPG